MNWQILLKVAWQKSSVRNGSHPWILHFHLWQGSNSSMAPWYQHHKSSTGTYWSLPLVHWALHLVMKSPSSWHCRRVKPYQWCKLFLSKFGSTLLRSVSVCLSYRNHPKSNPRWIWANFFWVHQAGKIWKSRGFCATTSWGGVTVIIWVIADRLMIHFRANCQNNYSNRGWCHPRIGQQWLASQNIPHGFFAAVVATQAGKV